MRIIVNGKTVKEVNQEIKEPVIIDYSGQKGYKL